MGRPLGAFADNEPLDRPDLNKCPDCNCFFEGDFCPSCGKECAEEMRAGNRPVEKPKKQKRAAYANGVPTPWYHAWWFLILMLVVFPLAGIVLLITSRHTTWKKVLLVIIAVAYLLLPGFFGIGSLISGITDAFDQPVDDSLTREEYIAKCEEITPEQFYRAADSYEDKFVSMTVQITEKVTCIDEFYNDKDYVCYLCVAQDNYDFRIILRDCLLADKQRFIPGDVITIYGEGAGEREVYDSDYNYTTAPCLNMAYIASK